MQNDIGTVRPVDIDEEMRESYLDYAMSVIVSRALPDARDGLKPVHRRILYAMYDMGIRSNGAHRKSARIVGEVLGKYHPHGDQAVYDSMVRMAQEFSMRYPLVDGQGNFGSIDGDSAAAMRYTEARMASISEVMLEDIDMETVDFVDNFDGTLQEPEVLPGRLPNLLLNGTSGIAVGMATNIPPHNLNELAAAITYLIEQMTLPEDGTLDEELQDVTVEDLMQFVTAPDFPTGGNIVGYEGVINAYATGRGRVVVRAEAHTETLDTGRHRIVVTEIPYLVNKSRVIEHIASLVRSGRLDQISDLRDESDRRGLSIVIDLKRGAQPLTVLNRLYKYTQLQYTFGVQMLALVNNEPRLLSLKAALKHYITHRRDVIVRRTEYQLERAQRRAHVLEGLLVAIANLDAVIDTIRQSQDAEEARTRLMENFNLTEVQAQAILDMQLRRLAALERLKIEEEYQELQETIAGLEALLADPRKVLAVITEDLEQLVEKYGDERLTRIIPDEGDFDEEALIRDEAVLISITRQGYIKRVAASEYRAQGRAGKGVRGMTTRDEDELYLLFAAGSRDNILFFTNRGRVFSEKAYQIPDAGRSAKGVPLASVLLLENGEYITAGVPVPDFEEVEYCTMVTRYGRIKRVEVSAFESVRKTGLIAISLDEGDQLGWVKLTSGDDDLLIVTENGQSIRFHETDARAMGRTAAGVNAIRLQGDDRIAGADIVTEEGSVLVVTSNGYGKRTPVEEYSRQSRYGMGVRTLKENDRTGFIVGARVVQPDDHITLITNHGMAIRLRVEDISQYGRNTRGVRLMNLSKGDTVVAVALLEASRRAEREEMLAEQTAELEREEAAEQNAETGDPFEATNGRPHAAQADELAELPEDNLDEEYFEENGDGAPPEDYDGQENT